MFLREFEHYHDPEYGNRNCKHSFSERIGLSAIRYTGSKAEWDKYGLTEDDINHATVYYNYDPNHDHSYEETIIHPASCTETGLKKMICSLCGEFYEEEIPLQEHNVVIDEGVAATCETAGKTEEAIALSVVLCSKPRKKFRLPDIR